MKIYKELNDCSAIGSIEYDKKKCYVSDKVIKDIIEHEYDKKDQKAALGKIENTETASLVKVYEQKWKAKKITLICKYNDESELTALLANIINDHRYITNDPDVWMTDEITRQRDKLGLN